MQNKPRHDNHTSGYGCFWIAGWIGALIITALVVGEWLGSPRFDGPFGGIIWLIVQATCLITCLVGSCRAMFDSSINANQRKRMWILTLYPLFTLFIMIVLSN
jgi:hypothetical protein